MIFYYFTQILQDILIKFHCPFISVTIPISEENRDVIIDLLLDGYSYRDIQSQTDFGKNTTQGIVDDLRKKHGKNNIDNLLKIAKSFRKRDIPINDMFLCLRIYQVLQKLEFSGDEIYEFVNSIYSESTRRNISPKNIVESAQKLLHLNSDVPLEQIPTHYEQLLEKSKTLQQDITQLNESKLESLTDTKTALDKAHITQEKLNDFTTTRDVLQSHSKDTIDLTKLANMLENATTTNYDVEKIIRHISKVESFEDKHDTLEKQNKSLQSQNASLDDTILLQNESISQNKSILANLDKFTSIGVSLDDLELLYTKVIEISHTHGTLHDKSLQNLHHTIATQYDELVGFEKYIATKKDDIAKIDDTLLQSQHTLDELISENNLDGIIPAIQNLQKNNISISQLVSWQNILSTNNLDTQNLQTFLLEFTTLSNVLKNLKTQCDTLEQTKSTVQSHIDSLNSQKSDLIEYITNTKESSIQTIKEIQDYSQKSISSVTDISKKEISDVGVQTKSELSKSVDSFDTMINEISKASEVLGKLTAIKPLYDIINGVDIAPINAYIGISGFLELFFAWQKNRGITAPVISANTLSLINGIKKEIDTLEK